MFNDFQEVKRAKARKKELKAQLPALLQKYPVARKNHELSVSEKRAKMVLIAHITGLVTPYSAEYVAGCLYDIADYDFSLAPTYEKACQELGVTASSVNLGTATQFANNNPIVFEVVNYIQEYVTVSNA